MITDPTGHRPQNSSAFRRAAATATFLAAILNVSVGLACCKYDPRFDGPTSSASPPAAPPPPGGSADLKTCDKGLVYDAKKRKCVIKRSGAEPDLAICFPGQV